jgi:biopolymer transport protein ExbB
MWPIAGCSIIALAFAVERFVVLRRRRVIPRDFVTRFVEHLEQQKLDRATALQLCEENGSPMAQVFAHGVRKWGKPSVEVEQAIIDGGERQVSQLRSHLRVLNAVATVTPLLGLLGTVFGMIMCFNQIATSSAMGKAEQLAGGIGVALITTAGGLTVAIPSLILYMYLAGRVDALVMEMDALAQRVVNLISAEALAAQNAALRIAPRPKTVGTAAVKES